MPSELIVPQTRRHQAASSGSEAATDGLERFVHELRQARIGPTVNPYAPEHEVADLDRPGAALVRSRNLLEHLAARTETELLLVGEAPGYRGCRFSGIPFTSERSLQIECRSSRRSDGWQEPSATIVHGVLRELGMEGVTVLWNALPLHPTGEGPLSNRPPSAAELAAGSVWLDRLIKLLRPRRVLAVGRSASSILPGGPSLRHPSHGGAALFRAQLRAHVDR